MIYILIIAAVMVLDRIVKAYVDSNMNPFETIAVTGDFFHITYVRNTGAAFSILEGHSGILIIIPAVIIIIVLIYLFTHCKRIPAMLSWALSLICAGGLGNLIDRFMNGYVIDMFDFGSFPVFNVADISVCTGCGLLILYIILSEKSKPGEKDDRQPDKD